MATLITVDTLLDNEKIWVRTPYDRYILMHEVAAWLYTNAGSRRYLKHVIKNVKDISKFEIFNDSPWWGFWIIPVVPIPLFTYINQQPKIGRFFFTDRNTAMIFKLTWGGL